MTDAWKVVWEKRTLDPAMPSVLAGLMAADGLDTGFGSVGEAAWRAFAERVAERLGLAEGSTIFEVGCGGGAFLYPLRDRGLHVAGLDQSAALVSIARDAIPDGAFSIADASGIEPEPAFDAVAACGVFLYFPTLTYAAAVVTRMSAKARRALAILDVPDLASRQAAMAVRRGTLGAAAYDAKYRGLDHLYFERQWFIDGLTRLGWAHVDVEDQAIDGYANSAFRFNVFATRR